MFIDWTDSIFLFFYQLNNRVWLVIILRARDAIDCWGMSSEAPKLKKLGSQAWLLDGFPRWDLRSEISFERDRTKAKSGPSKPSLLPPRLVGRGVRQCLAGTPTLELWTSVRYYLVLLIIKIETSLGLRRITLSNVMVISPIYIL